jgi:ubiquinone/menaquinone biosynthesis C-methylase UbiE
MKKEKKTRVCPVEMAGGLDNFFRRIFQNPKKILRGYIKEGIKVLDLGCGPGYFTLEIARMLNNSGKVLAADLQEGMLNIVKGKIQDSGLENIIELHKSTSDEIGIKEKIDFVFAFYVVHEIPNKDNLFREINLMLAESGKFFIVEPLIHVSKIEFELMIDKLRSFGFEVIKKPKLLFSRAVLMRKIGDA